jgi:GntR family hexuronate regulon transcriptional repressor
MIGMQAGPNDTQKLYQQIARAIAAAIADGRYGPGDRLPSERELAEEFSVSRPTVRDAMIALEFQGLVEARQGSGVYVTVVAPAVGEALEPEVTALALTEARRLFEGEVCALSAACITDEQLAQLERLVADMPSASGVEEAEKLEQEFHLAVARASGNAAIASGVEDLWAMRRLSSSCTATLRRVCPSADVIDEHRKILATLREHDSKAARQALHLHLTRVIDDLLTLTESDALEQTRQKMAEQRRVLSLRNKI